MPRPSRTELAVLGALSTGPMTGYEVRAAIGESLGHFWHESFGQIYPTLASLADAGLVRPLAAGRGSGTVHEITPAGVDRLRDLLAEPHQDAPARNGMLLRLFFGAHLPEGAAEALLHDAAQRAEAALAEFVRIREEVGQDDDPEQAYRTMTLSYGEHVARAQLTWARECLASLPATTEAHRARG